MLTSQYLFTLTTSPTSTSPWGSKLPAHLASLRIGICSWAFSKVMKAVVALLKSWGIRTIIYINYTLDVDVFASRLTHQIPHFFSWRPDPLVEAVDSGCVATRWGPTERLCQLTVVRNWQSPEPGILPASLTSAGSSSVEGSNLVPSTTRDVVGLRQTDSPSPRSN